MDSKYEQVPCDVCGKQIPELRVFHLFGPEEYIDICPSCYDIHYMPLIPGLINKLKAIIIKED